MFLGFPTLLHLRGLRDEHLQFRIECIQTLLAGHIGFFGKGNFLNLKLHDASLHDIDLGRHRINFDSQFAGCFVHQVDGLVGQKSIGEVAVGKHRGAHQCVVLNSHTVVHLVALLQPAQDRNGVFDGGLTHVHLLESAFECSVLFDMGPVFVERCCANHAELAASQHRLHHVSCIHGTLCAACANEGVDFIHEGDHFSTCIGDLLQHGLQTFLELAAILCAGQHRTKIERNQPLGFESLGYVPGCNALCKSFHDRGLPDTGFTDEDGVVLRATRQHLHYPTNFFIPPDNGVDLSGTRACSEIDAVLLQGLKLILWILRRDPMGPSHGAQGVQQLLAWYTNHVMHGEQEYFDGEKLVTKLRLHLLGCGEHCSQFTIETRLRASLCIRQFGECCGALLHHLVHRHAHLGKERRHDGAILFHQL